MQFISLILLAASLAACSHIPEPIRTAPVLDISLAAARKNPEFYRDKAVRWGGTLLSVSNLEHSSQLQILGYPLRSNGRPDQAAQTQGRFLATTEQFIDPEAYKSGTEITLSGQLTGSETLIVGKTQITVPVVSASYIYPWPQYDDRYNRYGQGYYCPYPSYRYGYGYHGRHYGPFYGYGVGFRGGYIY
ncbi:MAG: Slp family lipoprotein [Methylococcales bacterium]|nr:Slp family lipoprotein [Methylococcales bacterium]